MIKEEAGKPLHTNPSTGKKANHDRIGEVIQAANAQFRAVTDGEWSLSRDARYQMSNRFASACKLAEFGHPIILLYLGLLKANEMADRGKPFASAAEWEALVRSHSESLFPAAVWNQPWMLHRQTFVPLIRSVEWPLNPETKA